MSTLRATRAYRSRWSHSSGLSVDRAMSRPTSRLMAKLSLRTLSTKSEWSGTSHVSVGANRQRFADKVTLHVMASQIAQQLELFVRFDAFGKDAQRHGVAQT